MEGEQLERFEAIKRRSLAQLLIRCARRVNERGVMLARERLGYPHLTAANMQLFPHIPFDGVRQTELARAMGVSKQAIGQLVGPMVAAGVLERVPDPSDRRAKLVRFSDRGKDALFQGMAVLMEVEQPLREALGDDRADQLLALLQDLDDALEASVD